MTSPQFRTPQEHVQVYPRHKTFTAVATSDAAFDVVVLSNAMEECNKISLVVDLADAYIEFDGDATTSSMLVPAGTGYFDDGIFIKRRISARNAIAGQNTRIRGIAWGR